MLKNQQLAEQIFLVINKLIELSTKLKSLLEINETVKFKRIAEDLYVAVKSVGELAPSLKEEENGLNLPAAIESIKHSLIRILSIERNDKKRALHKIEFELIPLIEEMRINFYWWAMVYPNKERMKNYYEKDIQWLGGNKYTEEAERKGYYKYDLSIFILGYNKKEYTQMCLDSLYNNLPQKISYEIILVNHGSKDGTKELFEKYHPDKQLDIAVNGGGSNAVYRIAEGKYIMMISNDIIITQNVIDNMYRCINSDDEIAWVVPTTPNVSNLQTIPGGYTSYEEMIEFAKKNNVSNPYRWEQRVRLCNPVDMVRARFLEETKVQFIYHSKNRMSFPDDKKSLICRRNGYKMYLVKDAFCYHFGSVTLGEDEKTNSAMAYAQGRRDFYEAFGIDPWISSCCYDYNLVNSLPLSQKESIKILGVDCGLGSNPLKIKELLKERNHNTKSFICNYLSDVRYLRDIESVSDKTVLYNSREELSNIGDKFDYIVDGSLVDNVECLNKERKRYELLLEENGVLCLLISSVLTDMLKAIKDEYENIIVLKESMESLMAKDDIWLILKK